MTFARSPSHSCHQLDQKQINIHENTPTTEADRRCTRKKTSVDYKVFLKNIGGQFSKLGAFTFAQGDVGRDFLTLETLNRVGESAVGRVDIGVVDLIIVTRKHDFGPLTRAGDDGFNFMGS